MYIRNRAKLIIVGALTVAEGFLCLAIIGVLAVSQISLPKTRFFQIANTRGEETIEQSFAADGPAKLDLTNSAGDVEISASDDDRFVVRAVKEAWGRDQRDAQAKAQSIEVSMALEEGTLTVRVEEPEKGSVVVFGTVRSSRVGFEIAVPRRTAVVVHTRSGRLTLEGTQGDAELYDRYGPVSVQDVTGSITVDTNNGKVTVLHSGGKREELSLSSTYADIVVQQVEANALTLDSNNGALRLEDVAVVGDLDLQTRYGEIALERVQGSVLRAETHNEAISLQDVEMDGALSLVTQYGDVTTRDVTGSEMNVHVDNGKLELERVAVEGDLVVDSKYVPVSLDGVHAKSLSIKGNNGDITFNDVQLDGPLSLSTEYGAVQVARTEASEYRIETNNSPIVLHGGHGVLWVHNKYGDIVIEGAHRAALDLRTTNGEVSFQGTLEPGADHHLESTYGPVSLRLPPDTAVTLDASTEYGRIHSEFDVLVKSQQDEQEKPHSGDALYGTINGGGPELKIRTTNSDITIEVEPAG